MKHCFNVCFLDFKKKKKEMYLLVCIYQISRKGTRKHFALDTIKSPKHSFLSFHKVIWILLFVKNIPCLCRGEFGEVHFSFCLFKQLTKDNAFPLRKCPKSLLMRTRESTYTEWILRFLKIKTNEKENEVCWVNVPEGMEQTQKNCTWIKCFCFYFLLGIFFVYNAKKKEYKSTVFEYTKKDKRVKMFLVFFNWNSKDEAKEGFSVFASTTNGLMNAYWIFDLLSLWREFIVHHCTFKAFCTVIALMDVFY